MFFNPCPFLWRLTAVSWRKNSVNKVINTCSEVGVKQNEESKVQVPQKSALLHSISTHNYTELLFLFHSI